MHNSRKGFTLAEVLVTLAIIGVVAALTIPTLIQSTNGQKYQTAFKKSVSVLNQALTTAAADQGIDASSSGVTDNLSLANVFSPYLNILRKDASGNIWLSDGSKIGFAYTASTTCGATTNATTVTNFDPSLATHTVASACYAIIDVNGDKGPNRVATASSPSDVYIVAVLPNRVVPMATDTALVLATVPANFNTNSSGGVLATPYVDTGVPGTAAIAALTGST